MSSSHYLPQQGQGKKLKEMQIMSECGNPCLRTNPQHQEGTGTARVWMEADSQNMLLGFSLDLAMLGSLPQPLDLCDYLQYPLMKEYTLNQIRDPTIL